MASRGLRVGDEAAGAAAFESRGSQDCEEFRVDPVRICPQELKIPSAGVRVEVGWRDQRGHHLATPVRGERSQAWMLAVSVRGVSASLLVMVILRGLACSATGMRNRRTPAV